ncbi:T9SS type A sorting domain-containing protein [Calditrichota bacterium GD2]
MDGLIWGGIVKTNDSPSEIDTPRVGGIHYRVGAQAGHVIRIDDELIIDASSMGIFKIKKNWQNLHDVDLIKELKVLYNLPESQITPNMLEELRQKYAKDWKNWPVNLGAPYVDVNENGIYDPVLDANGYPLPGLGDYPGMDQAEQTLFMVVNDLDSVKVKSLSGSEPLGLEVQITLWSYDTDFLPLAHTIFKRYVFVNKSKNAIDSMFVGQFVDADVGDYSDDLIGCDTLLNLAFAFNGNEVDFEAIKKDLPPPALGYCLLQGPMVETGNTSDIGYKNLNPLNGFKNLPMTSFVYWASGGSLADPPLGVIDYTLQMYNMLNGYIPTNDLKYPTPYVAGSGPNAGQPTKFPLSGDPINDPQGLFGDVDGRGWNMGPSDRRFMMNTGPFTLRPDESQEIILAIIGGLERDRLGAVKQVKNIVNYLRAAYQNQFKNVLPKPEVPQVKATPFDEYVVLNWGWDAGSVQGIEQQVKNGFRFEGYNVYQLPRADAGLDDPRTVKIATFDLINDVAKISGLKAHPVNGRYYETMLQEGSNSGVKHYLVIKEDQINKTKFYRGSSYYFAVTSYNYNPELPEYPSLESDYQTVSVIIQDEPPGDRYFSEAEQEIEVVASKESNVLCLVNVVDPAAVTGHDYQVYFTPDTDTASANYGTYLWNLKDLTTGLTVLTGQIIKELEEDTPPDKMDEDQLIVDGLLVQVLARPNGLAAIVQVAGAEGILTREENVWHSLSWIYDPNRFYISAGGGNGTIDRLLSGINHARCHDFELRFTDSGGWYLWWDEDSNKVAARMPFEAWDVGPATYDDPSDDIRCLTGGYSGGATPGVFDFAYQDPFFGYAATDWIDIRKPLNEQGSYQAFAQDIESGAFTYQWWDNSVEVLSNIIICDFGGARTLPPSGTVIRFITTKGADQELTFTFTAPDKIEDDLDLMKKDVEKINVFPNPYYAASRLEPDRFTHFVTFNHLPPRAVIRIFTLNGVLVRKLEKNEDSQFFRWDLKNEKGRPVASGMYIIHIDMPELGKQKILKLLVIASEQIH